MSSSREPLHRPVLAAETLRLLNPQLGGVWVDCTVGGGGHARLIAEAVGETGRVIGLDQDETMLALARALWQAGPRGASDKERAWRLAEDARALFPAEKMVERRAADEVLAGWRAQTPALAAARRAPSR